MSRLRLHSAAEVRHERRRRALIRGHGSWGAAVAAARERAKRRVAQLAALNPKGLRP